MRFVDINGKLRSSRRFTTRITRNDVDVDDKDKLVDTILVLSKRLDELEGRSQPEATEFEVDVGRSGAEVRLEHRYGAPVRWYVTSWTETAQEDLLANQLWVGRGWMGPALGSGYASVVGNFTVGCRFQITRACKIHGVRFLWKNPGAGKTIKCSLWLDSSGARLASGTVSVSDNGIYTCEFSSPVDISGSLLNVDLTVSAYETGGGSYTKTTASDAIRTNLNFRWPTALLKANNLFLAGDARPTSGAGTEDYWVEPFIAPPITPPHLVKDESSSTADQLVLKSYRSGRAVIRVEPSQQETTI